MQHRRLRFEKFKDRQRAQPIVAPTFTFSLLRDGAVFWQLLTPMLESMQYWRVVSPAQNAGTNSGIGREYLLF